MKVTAYLILLFSIVSCQDPAAPMGSIEDGEILIKYGQDVPVPDHDLVIRFSELKEDSRCPKLVHCVWAGNAQILLLLNDKEYHLNTLQEPQEITFGDYNVNLVALEPYPVYGQKIEKESYIATLAISRN